MDKFFIREIAAVWAFNKYNEAVWKCSNVGRLKITQEGETIRKKDAQGATIFKMDTAKSANISFEVSYWDFNILALLSGAETRSLDGTENPYLTEPIRVPYAETHTITAADVSNGFIILDEAPYQYPNGSHEIALHKTNKGDAILDVYSEGIVSDEKRFNVQGNKIMLPLSLNDGDMIETVYEFNSYSGVELVNTATGIPETWKVRILMLTSPICNTDIVEAVWVTARNATPDIGLSLDFGVDDNIPISLELGYSICDDEKRLYEIVTAGRMNDDDNKGEPLRANNSDIVRTYDYNSVNTVD